MELAVGTVVSGKVTTITKFGAFVALPGGKSGLVHISEVAAAFVSDVHDFLTEGQEVQVKILSISPEGKINLSVKQAQTAPQEDKPRTAYRTQPTAQRGGQRNTVAQAVTSAAPTEQTFEDKLKQFMTMSDSKMSELNRNRDGTRHKRR